MRYQAGIQIILIIISIVIIYMVIKPKFEEIAVSQDETAKYNDAVNKANEYNAKLQELISRANSMPRTDQVDLDKFLPKEINPTVVARDITNIVEKNGLLMLDITAGNLVSVTVDNTAMTDTGEEGMVVFEDALSREARNQMNSQIFTLNAGGGYEQMKAMLADFERNAYPLRLVKFSFDASREDSILYRYSIELETYALNTASVK